MKERSYLHLSRRERQIMDILYRLGEATASEVMDNLPESPSYSAVRALLRILEEKGHITHRQVGPRYIYHPCISVESIKESAMQHVLTTFFEGSVAQAVSTLLDISNDSLPEDELERLTALIEKASKEG